MPWRLRVKRRLITASVLLAVELRALLVVNGLSQSAQQNLTASGQPSNCTAAVNRTLTTTVKASRFRLRMALKLAIARYTTCLPPASTWGLQITPTSRKIGSTATLGGPQMRLQQLCLPRLRAPVYRRSSETLCTLTATLSHSTWVQLSLIVIRFTMITVLTISFISSTVKEFTRPDRQTIKEALRSLKIMSSTTVSTASRSTKQLTLMWRFWSKTMTFSTMARVHPLGSTDSLPVDLQSTRDWRPI